MRRLLHPLFLFTSEKKKKTFSTIFQYSGFPGFFSDFFDDFFSKCTATLRSILGVSTAIFILDC